MIGFSFLVSWSVVRQPERTNCKCDGEDRIFFLFDLPLASLLGFSFCVSFFARSALAFWIAMVLAITFGIVMSELIEIPVLRWRDRLFREHRQVWTA